MPAFPDYMKMPAILLINFLIQSHSDDNFIDLPINQFFVHRQNLPVLHRDLSVNDNGIHLGAVRGIGKARDQVISRCQGRRIQIQNCQIRLLANLDRTGLFFKAQRSCTVDRRDTESSLALTH